MNNANREWFEGLCRKRDIELPISYLEVLLRTADWVAEEAEKNINGKLFLGISSAQGSGKSTFSDLLKESLEYKFGLPALLLSLDDFYLTRDERLELAQSVHPLLATRGVPGTHDVKRLATVVEEIKKSETTLLPRFNKAEDDRGGEEAVATRQIKIVICEGWCWGAKPVPEGDLSEAVNELEEREDKDGRWRRYINERLADYQGVFSTDLSIFLAVPDMDSVLTWRWQQEQSLSSGSRIMNIEDTRRFVMHYERITLDMLKRMPSQADLTLRLGTDHSFIG